MRIPIIIRKIFQRINFEIIITLKYFVSEISYEFHKESFQKVQILSDSEVVDEIIKNKVSVSRFGDGELKWIMNIPQDSFERESIDLSKRLKEVITSNNSSLLVCIPDAFGELNDYRFSSRRFWRVYMHKYRRNWMENINLNQIYGNSLITRPYMSYKNKDNSTNKFESLKKIWEERDITIIEGAKTYLGIGNDLLCNAKSIRRIIAPEINAFSKYDEILDNACQNVDKKDLILIALGPTATILAYDLCMLGYQALDIGHIDIEYEWFLSKARNKQVVVGKYVNETGKKWIEPKESFLTDDYRKSVILTIKA